VVCRVSVVPYQHVVLCHPEYCQSQAASEELAFDSTKLPRFSWVSSAPFERRQVLGYEVM